MANTSIGGLVSGLDTATIINQLMQLEAQSQTRLKSKVTTEQSAITALQSLNTKLSTLMSKAGELAKVTGWTAATATSDNEHVTAVAATNVPGSLTFSVNNLASPTRATYQNTATATTTGTVPADTMFDVVDADGVKVGSFDSGNGSLAAVASAINGSGAGLTASLVRVGSDAEGAAVYRLNVSSAKTGEDTGFSIVPQTDHADTTAFLGGTSTYVAGVDASITLAGEVTPLTSASNTFKDLMPGVDVTLGAKATGTVTVNVAPDASALSDKVKAMVDSVNAVLADIDSLTNYNAATKKAGLLGGDSTLRSVRDQLLNAVVGGSGTTSLATVGVQVDRNGKLTFDADKFKASYAAEPTKAMDLFVDTDGDGIDRGLATGLEALAKKFGNSTDGVVTSLVKGRQSTIDGLNDAIESWDSRLALRRTALERQYGALEVALGKLQSQSSWLAGQIASLPQMSSGS